MPTIEIPNIEIMPDWTQLIVQLISLCLLFFIFKRYAWKPTKAFLNERQAFLNAGFKEAEEAKAEGWRLKKDYENRIGQAKEEAATIIETSRNEGRIKYDDMIAEARIEVNERLAKVAIAIEEDKLVAHEKIKEDLLELAIDGAKAVIKKEIDMQVHEQLFADFIAKVGHEYEA